MFMYDMQERHSSYMKKYAITKNIQIFGMLDINNKY